MVFYGEWQEGLVWDAVLRVDATFGNSGQIVHLTDHPEPPDPGLRIDRIMSLRGNASISNVTPSAGHSEAMWDSAREGGPTGNPTNSTLSSSGPQATYAAANPGPFSNGSVQWLADIHASTVYLNVGAVEHTGTPPEDDWPAGVVGVESQTGVDLTFLDAALSWSERPGGLATGLGSQFDVLIKAAGVDGPDLMQLNAGFADTLTSLSNRGGPATVLDVGDLNPLLEYPGTINDDIWNTRALFLYWAFAALVDDNRPAGTDGAGNDSRKINKPDFDLSFQFQTAPWRYVYSVPPTFQAAEQLYPRSDGLATGSADQVYPIPDTYQASADQWGGYW